jgi:hypothetical protein
VTSDGSAGDIRASANLLNLASGPFSAFERQPSVQEDATFEIAAEYFS